MIIYDKWLYFIYYSMTQQHVKKTNLNTYPGENFLWNSSAWVCTKGWRITDQDEWYTLTLMKFGFLFYSGCEARERIKNHNMRGKEIPIRSVSCKANQFNFIGTSAFMYCTCNIYELPVFWTLITDNKFPTELCDFVQARHFSHFLPRLDWLPNCTIHSDGEHFDRTMLRSSQKSE